MVFPLFYISITVSPPSYSPVPFLNFLSTPPPYTLPPSPFRKGQAFHGLEQCMAHQVEAGLSICIKALR